MKFELC